MGMNYPLPLPVPKHDQNAANRTWFSSFYVGGKPEYLFSTCFNWLRNEVMNPRFELCEYGLQEFVILTLLFRMIQIMYSHQDANNFFSVPMREPYDNSDYFTMLWALLSLMFTFELFLVLYLLFTTSLFSGVIDVCSAVHFHISKAFTRFKHLSSWQALFFIMIYEVWSQFVNGIRSPSTNKR